MFTAPTRLRFFFAIAIVLQAPLAQAQSGRYTFQEYADSITAAQKRTALGDDTFGERVSLFSGSTEFSITDVSIPGNNDLPVSLGRRLVIQDRRRGSVDLSNNFLGGFDDWDVEVPYLEGTFSAAGWVVQDQNAQATANRCSNAARPHPESTTHYAVWDIWSGYNLHIPGSSDEKLAFSVAGAHGTPSDGQPYPWVARGNIRFRCLTQTANGYPGEGFIGVTPEGEKYYFNWVIERQAVSMRSKYPLYPFTVIPRKRVLILATRIEDVFGNWVNYTYASDKLTQISSSDGRVIDLTYTNGKISSATANGKTWLYAYSPTTTANDGGLSLVTLPDTSSWAYSKAGHLYELTPIPNGEGQECDPIDGDRPGPFSYNAVHPSGLRTTFLFQSYRIYRGAASTCSGPQPSYYDVWGLISKVASGPGINSQTTTYSTSNGYPATAIGKWTSVTRPDGTKSRYRYGTTVYSNEGLLLEEQVLDSADNIKFKKVSDYQLTTDATAPFAIQIGLNPHYSQYDSTLIRPVKSTVITQDGVAFSSTVNSFDSFARPLNITKSSAPVTP